MGGLMYHIHADDDDEMVIEGGHQESSSLTTNNSLSNAPKEEKLRIGGNLEDIKSIICERTQSYHRLRFCFWSFCVLLYVATNFMSYWRTCPTWLVATIMSAGKCLFSVCVGGVIVMCTCGHGRRLNAFLGGTLFRFLSQLSYSIYMLAPLVVVTVFGLRIEPTKFTEIGSGADFVFVIVISILSALLMVLLLELPMQRIATLLFKGTKPANATADSGRKDTGNSNNYY